MVNLTEKYSDQILRIMKPYKSKVDYWDIRFGEGNTTSISYRSKILEEITFPKRSGGSVRILYKGGWGFVTFRDVGELVEAAEKAWLYAKLTGSSKSQFAKSEVIFEKVVVSEDKKDFAKISVEEKINLLNSYRDRVWKKKSAVVESQLSYADNLSQKLFVSSDGSVIEQESARIRSMLAVTARKEGIVQRYHAGLTFINFADLKGKEKKIDEVLEVVNQLVNAPAAQGGEFPVVMDGKLAGTFAHEAFGHLSEADNVSKDEQLKKIMVLGKHFGSEIITIYDDPNVGNWGNYKYDDEGIPAKKSVLLDKGVLVGRLNNRETAAILNEEVNGHGRAGGVESRPLVRMGTTIVAPGKSDKKDLFKGIKKGYYCVSWIGGMTDHENFTFTAAYGYEINNGKLGQIVRDLKISGNLFETLKEIEGVGSDLVEEPGTCGKMDQNLPVGTIAPSIRLGKVLVMGV